MGKEDIVGEIFINNNGEQFKVNKYLYCKNTEYYYEVEFIKTHSKKMAEKRNIKYGRVRDDYSKHIYGVACKGNASSTYPKFNKLAFKRWYAMIERCYNKDAYMYPSYGGKGVIVDDRWLCFENYIKDIKEINGFDYDKYISGSIQLDKDMFIDNNLVYSKDTCCFISRSKNAKYQPSKMKKFIAISSDGDSYVFNNQNECAREFGLTARTIGKVLNGDLKSHKGWTFRYIQQDL
jgi:hypothetical protein